MRTMQLILAGWVCTFLAASVTTANAGQLYVGGASVSITPEGPVAIDGMRDRRIAKSVAAECTASALVLETRDGDTSLGQVIFVSCDLIAIRDPADFYPLLRKAIADRVPESAAASLIVNGTHTHNAPVQQDGKYDLDKYKGEVLKPAEYRQFLYKQLGDAVAKAWEKRVPAQMAWGLGHAEIAQNRRMVYADGRAVMYGNTDQSGFRGIEGYEDHSVQILYFWDQNDQLIATCINVAAPSQGAGGGAVHADYWHFVRETLREKHGEDLTILAWCGAAGDQEVRSMYRRASEDRMQKLRGGLTRIQELARRIVVAWEDVLPLVKTDRHSDIELEYHEETISLPERKVTEGEYAKAQQEVVKWKKVPDDPKAPWTLARFERVVNRYELQQKEPQVQEMVLRVVRLGDIAIATNDFELYTDYGVQIQARSPALQTFIIQLCGGGTYLPSVRAVHGGGYGAEIESNRVGPDAGQVLVDETVEALDQLWK